MANILIVDDEQKIREVLREYVTFDGHTADEAADGMEAVAKVKANKYDLVIMDVMMPKLDGYSAVKEIRKISDIPVIMLSARVEEYDKLFGFEVGADDYVTKPFSPKEVLARISAILKRKKAEMTPKEYELLFYLTENAGIAVSREKLLTDVWGYDFFGDDRTVDTHIKMLRASLGPYRDKIVTLRGLGYKLEL